MFSAIAGPSCPAAPFSISPVADDSYDFITPLGHLNPPDHTLPSDHVYFILKRDQPYPAPARPADVFAPADMRIIGVTESLFRKDGRIVNQDYSIDFYPCAELRGRFGHISEITVDLKRALDSADKQCQEYGTGGDGTMCKRCTARTDIPVKAGQKIGTAGGKSAAALDVWVYDNRLPQPAYANPIRYNGGSRQTPPATCFVNYVSEPLRSVMRSRLGGMERGAEGRRTREPLCGEINQDVPGTLAGNWFHNGVQHNPQGWQNEMGFVHNAVDPSVEIVSVGGIIAGPGLWWFVPKHEGAVNREFSEVRPGEAVYCYDSTGNSGRILVRLASDTQLQAEKQDGSCGSLPLFFQNLSTYER